MKISSKWTKCAGIWPKSGENSWESDKRRKEKVTRKSQLKIKRRKLQVKKKYSKTRFRRKIRSDFVSGSLKLSFKLCLCSIEFVLTHLSHWKHCSPLSPIIDAESQKINTKISFPSIAWMFYLIEIFSLSFLSIYLCLFSIEEQVPHQNLPFLTSFNPQLVLLPCKLHNAFGHFRLSVKFSHRVAALVLPAQLQNVWGVLYRCELTHRLDNQRLWQVPFDVANVLKLVLEVRVKVDEHRGYDDFLHHGPNKDLGSYQTTQIRRVSQLYLNLFPTLSLWINGWNLFLDNKLKVLPFILILNLSLNSAHNLVINIDNDPQAIHLIIQIWPLERNVKLLALVQYHGLFEKSNLFPADVVLFFVHQFRLVQIQKLRLYRWMRCVKKLRVWQIPVRQVIVWVWWGQAVVVGWVVRELWSHKVLLVLIIDLRAFARFAELIAVVLTHFLALIQVSRVYLAHVVLSHFDVVWLILLLDHSLRSSTPWHYLAFQSFVLLAQVRDLWL